MTPAERLADLAEGSNPALVAKLKSGYVVMADNQFLRGYCLLLGDPLVGQLNDLPVPQQHQFLADMAHLGQAIRAATGCKRINYGIYGNVDPYLHAHVWPRYEDEELFVSSMPPLAIPLDLRTDPVNTFDPNTHGNLLRLIQRSLLDPELEV